jgi:hypothetical protein
MTLGRAAGRNGASVPSLPAAATITSFGFRNARALSWATVATMSPSKP